MTADLKRFLAQYSDFDRETITDIVSRFKLKKIPKNGFILQAGKVCNELVFLQEGCLRLYYLADATEISVWFAFKNTSAIDISSFISGKPSVYFLQAIEDSEVWCLSKTTLMQLYLEYPPMQEMIRKFWEDAIVNLIDRFTALQTENAEQRYRKLLARPPYLQKIPQKYLASFIGVTPTSLSRLKKKIRQK